MDISVAAVNPQQSTSRVGQAPVATQSLSKIDDGKKVQQSKDPSKFPKQFMQMMEKQLEAQIKTDQSQEKTANANVKKAIHGDY